MVLCLGHAAPDKLPTLELGLSNLGLLGSELVNRPYLTLGILTWLILLALAATSTLWAMRKLGAKWQMLHNFVYLAAILAPIHYLWSVKTFSPAVHLRAAGGGAVGPALQEIPRLVALITRRRALLSLKTRAAGRNFFCVPALIFLSRIPEFVDLGLNIFADKTSI